MKTSDKGYKRLEIYQLAHSLAVRVHKMSLTLPAHERYEEGSQIRRSSKSVSSNIVEGYALRRYKAEFIHYLFRAYASGQETIEHLELLLDSGSLTDYGLVEDLLSSYNTLVGKLLRYIQAVDDSFEMPLFMKEPEIEYIAESSEPVRTESQTPNPKPQTSS